MFTLVGSSMVARLNPTTAPRRTRTRDTPSHSAIRVRMVVKGTALDDPLPHIIRFRTNHVANICPGK